MRRIPGVLVVVAVVVGTTVAVPGIATAEEPAAATLWPPSTVTPKRMGYGAGPAGPAGGVGGVGTPSLAGTSQVLRETYALIEEGGDVAGAVYAAATGAVPTYKTYLVEAWFEIYDELHRTIFRDEISFRYRQSTTDGTISGVTFESGLCRTGAGVAPHFPVTKACWWEPGYLGGDMFSFVTGSTMSYYAGPVEVGRIWMDLQFAAYRDGSWHGPEDIKINGLAGHCPVSGDMPLTWDRECDVTRTEV